MFRVLVELYTDPENLTKKQMQNPAKNVVNHLANKK